MFRFRIATALFVMSFALPAVAESQEEQAAAIDQEARTAFADGDYKLAAERFDEANRLVPHAELRYNAALAWEKAGEKSRAADGYEAALRQGGLDEQRAGSARSALAALKQTLGTVQVLGPLGGVLTVGHLKRSPIPAQFHLAPGSYTLRVERGDGSTATKAVQVRAGEMMSTEVEAPNATLGSARRPQQKPPPQESPPALTSSSQATWGWVALGGGVVLGGVGAYFGAQTLAASDDYEASKFTDSDARDRGVQSRLITNIALGSAVVAVGIGSYLLLTSGGSESAVRSRWRRGASAASWAGPRF